MKEGRELIVLSHYPAIVNRFAARPARGIDQRDDRADLAYDLSNFRQGAEPRRCRLTIRHHPVNMHASLTNFQPKRAPDHDQAFQRKLQVKAAFTRSPGGHRWTPGDGQPSTPVCSLGVQNPTATPEDVASDTTRGTSKPMQTMLHLFTRCAVRDPDVEDGRGLLMRLCPAANPRRFPREGQPSSPRTSRCETCSHENDDTTNSEGARHVSLVSNPLVPGRIAPPWRLSASR